MGEKKYTLIREQCADTWKRTLVGLLPLFLCLHFRRRIFRVLRVQNSSPSSRFLGQSTHSILLTTLTVTITRLVSTALALKTSEQDWHAPIKTNQLDDLLLDLLKPISDDVSASLGTLPVESSVLWPLVGVKPCCWWVFDWSIDRQPVFNPLIALTHSWRQKNTNGRNRSVRSCRKSTGCPATLYTKTRGA